MTLLRIDGSILGPNSASSELADIALAVARAPRTASIPQWSNALSA